MSRKDSFGVEVEVGDIVLSCPKHKYSGGPTVGQVCGVFESGRVTMKYPHKVAIYAYQRGAPDKEVESYTYGPLTDENGEAIYEDITDYYGRAQRRVKSGRIPYKYMTKDYTVVDHKWIWVKGQAADITLIVLRKGDTELKDLADAAGINDLTRNLNLNYEADAPELD